MCQRFLCCAILQDEIEHIMAEMNVQKQYLDAALHVDLKILRNSVTDALNNIDNKDNLTVVFGTQCHPEMEEVVAAQGARIVQARNCIEMLLGDKMAELDAECRTFYISSGWLANWRKIFVEGIKWDKVDARQNFGFYDRIVYLDTGLIPLDDEKVLEFFDYAEVPIEVIPVSLDNLRRLLLAKQ